MNRRRFNAARWDGPLVAVVAGSIGPTRLVSIPRALAAEAGSLGSIPRALPAEPTLRSIPRTLASEPSPLGPTTLL